MRKLLKFFHTIASAGLVGGFLTYLAVLTFAPGGDAIQYAAARQTIALVCTWVLIPSMAVVLVSGLLAIAVHRPFQELRWVWVKALLGLSVFEAVLGTVQSKGEYGARIAAELAQRKESPAALIAELASEPYVVGIILALSVANIALGVWRPVLKRRVATSQ